MIYLDTSVWLKRYYLEEGSEWVRTLFRDDILLACATLGLVEVYATLARKHKAGQLETDLNDAIKMQVERDWTNFTRVEFDTQVLEMQRRLLFVIASVVQMPFISGRQSI